MEGGGVSSKSVKKGKFVTKVFFPDNAEWSSNNFWKMMSADSKAKTTRNKRSSGLSYKSL